MLLEVSTPWRVQEDLVGRDIHCLLRSGSAAAEHARFFHSFEADGVLPPALSGAMRNVKLRAHDGSLIPSTLTITKAMVGGQSIVVASITDLRPVLVLEEVCARDRGFRV